MDQLPNHEEEKLDPNITLRFVNTVHLHEHVLVVFLFVCALCISSMSLSLSAVRSQHNSVAYICMHHLACLDLVLAPVHACGSASWLNQYVKLQLQLLIRDPGMTIHRYIGCRKPWQQQQLHSIRVLVRKMYTQQGHMPLGMEGCTGRVEKGARLSVPLTGYRKERKSRMRLRRLALMVTQVYSQLLLLYGRSSV